jgi:hypothetical protein
MQEKKNKVRKGYEIVASKLSINSVSERLIDAHGTEGIPWISGASFAALVRSVTLSLGISAALISTSAII